jgi:hypothetical protein
LIYGTSIDGKYIIAGLDSTDDRDRTEGNHFRHTQTTSRFILATIKAQPDATSCRRVSTRRCSSPKVRCIQFPDHQL